MSSENPDGARLSVTGYCASCAKAADGVFCSTCGTRLMSAAPPQAPRPDSQYTGDGICRDCNKAVEAAMRALHPRYCADRPAPAPTDASSVEPAADRGIERRTRTTGPQVEPAAVRNPEPSPGRPHPASTAWAVTPPGWYADPHGAAQVRYWDGTTWTSHTSPAAAIGFAHRDHNPSAAYEHTLIRRLTEYSHWSGVAWIVLGAVQILTLFGIIAGAWNVYAGYTRIRAAKDIERRDPNVPASVQSLAGYVIIGLINLFLGGVIGLVLVGVDLFVRDQILKNTAVFTPASLGQPPAAHATAQPGVAL